MFKRWFNKVSLQVGRYNAMLKGFERANSQSIDPAMAYVQWGVEQADGGDITGSIDKFKQAVSLSPTRPEGYTNWGVALAKLGQLEAAVEKFEQAIERAPHHATNYMLLGAALLEKGDLQLAASQYAKASELDPTNPSPLINHGVALARIGQHSDAIAHFKKALALQKHQPHVYFLWGAALAELGQHQQAIEKFKLTIRYMPKHVEALSFWAVSLNELEQHQLALTKAQEVLALNADKPDVYLTIGDALANLGQLEPALQAYEQALQLDASQIDAMISLGMVHAQLGHWTQAEAAFESAQALDPTDSQVNRAWGLYLMQAALTSPERYAEAINRLLPHCQSNPDDWVAQTQLAMAWVQTDEWSLAETAVADLLTLRPYDPDILALNAQLLQHKGMWHEAHQALEKVYAAQPTAERAIQLTQLLLAQGNPPDAVRMMRPWYRKQPEKLAVALTYALALRDDGHHREALDKLNQLQSQHPNHPGVLVALTESYLNLGQTSMANPLVQTLLTLQPELPVNRWLQSWTLLQHYTSHKTQQGLADLRHAVDAFKAVLNSAQHPHLAAMLHTLEAFIAGETTDPTQGLTWFDHNAPIFNYLTDYRQQLSCYWSNQPPGKINPPIMTLFANN